jgi:RecA-family ATPase
MNGQRSRAGWRQAQRANVKTANEQRATSNDEAPDFVTAVFTRHAMHGNQSFNLPSALSPLALANRWVCWRLESKPGDRKPTKPPYQPNGKHARNDDERTWSTIDVALKALINPANRFDGVGYMLMDDTVAAFDIDNCRDPTTGAIHPWAQKLIDKSNSYVEITPSGNGLRIIGLGNGPHLHRKLPVSDGVSCELYRQSKRYVTVTGNVLHDRPLAFIDALLDDTLAELEAKPRPDGDDGAASANDGRKLPKSLASLLHVEGSGPYPSRSELMFAFVTGALRAGVADATIIKACLDETYAGGGIFEHVEDNGGSEAYVERQIEHARKKIDGDDGDANDAPIRFLSIADWDSTPPPPREWAVQDYIPLKQPTLLSGDGGTGKTILLLQLCVATTLGQDWIGLTPRQGPAIYFGTEDDSDELHRRLHCIMAHHNEIFATVKDRLHVTSFAEEEDTMLARVDRRSGAVQPTPLYRKLFEQACDIKPVIIGLDTVSDIFPGNESDRAQVSAFVGLLRRLSIASRSGVIIAAHPSLQGMSSGTGLSGSTAWHAKVKSRMYFKAAVADSKGEDADPDLRVLEFRKNNYGKINDSIKLRWSNGLYLPPNFDAFDQDVAEHTANAVFLDLLNRFTRQGRIVSSKPGKNYAPAEFAQENEAKLAKTTNTMLAEAMKRLFSANRIREVDYGPPSRLRSRLIVVTP